MNTAPDHTPRIPMRAQGDNQPPPLTSRAQRLQNWRQGLRDALAEVNTEISSMIQRTPVEAEYVMTTAEQEVFTKVGCLVRNGLAIRMSGYGHVRGNPRVYTQEDSRPASQLETLLWAQAVSTFEELQRYQDSSRKPKGAPPLVTGEEFGRD